MELLATVGAAICALLLTTFLVGALRVLSDGTDIAEEIDRAGFGPAQFWGKKPLQRQPASSSSGTQEGLLGVGRGGRVEIEQTRTISVEMY